MRRWTITTSAIGLVLLAATYPTTIYDSQSPNTRRDTTLTQTEWNDVQDEITAIETHVGRVLCTFTQGACTGLNCVAPTCTGANTNETVIASCDAPANTFAAGKGVRYTLEGSFFANGNTKNVQVWFAANNLSGSSSSAQNGGGWFVEGMVLAVTGAAEIGHAIVRSSTGSVLGASQQRAMAEAQNSNITMKITGTNTTGHADDICALGGLIELIN